MDNNIERTTNQRINDTLEKLNTNKRPKSNKSSDSTIHQTRDTSIMMEDNIEATKKPTLQKLKAKIPPFPLFRTIIKASIAILIASLFVFVDSCRNAVGSGSTLVPIGTLLYSPVKPLGVQFETTIFGLSGALLGSAWSFLAMYLANLARDPTNPSPIQPNSSAVLAIFILIGAFWATYVRIKVGQAMFGAIFANIVIAFSLTQAAMTPGFQPIIIFAFLKPLALAAGIALMVDFLLWPEDSITKYMGILNKSLLEYNNFFQEHTAAFLSEDVQKTAMTLPSLHARLQNSVLKLIDCKREIQRELLFNQLSHDDIGDITRLVKSMRTPLHGIGLSVITKVERLEENHLPYFSAVAEQDLTEHKQNFITSLNEMRGVTQELVDTCVFVLEECNKRFMAFSGKPRSIKSSILWPFPRIFSSDLPDQGSIQESEYLLNRLDEVFEKYEQEAKKSPYIFIKPGTEKFERQFNSLLQVIYLFRFNLKEHAKHLRELIVCIQRIESIRIKKQFWVPRLSLRKWFRSMNGDIGAPITSDQNNLIVNNDLTLTQTRTRLEDTEGDEELVYCKNRRGKVYPRDPDVNPPESSREKFFLNVYRILRWVGSNDAIFCLKTAGGFILLSLPAFLPQSAGWFFAWRGQWATVTLMLWMVPMTGMLVFSAMLRVVGTVLGGVLGIIIWKITRGNPYGLTILNFFAMWPLYYIFFTNQILNITAIMTQVTNILVISYEYQYSVSGAPTYDSAELVAGKRMLLVIIGVASCAILSLIPKPVTGRVELRKRISKTLKDLSQLYGLLAADILIQKSRQMEPTPRQMKAFRKLALGIRRQIADEQTYLKLSKLEPPLRGKFPSEVYSKLVEKIDNMADLLQSMGYATRAMDKAWKMNLVNVIREERIEYLAAILSIMKMLSSTLASKMALPPFMLSPKELRNRLAVKLGQLGRYNIQDFDHGSFPGYCSFSICAYKFAMELEEVVECVEKLVGVEDPEEWLLLNA